MTRTEILSEATCIITKDRNKTHGDPEDNFKTIAEYWNSYLESCGLLSHLRPITKEDTAAMMVLVKLSRLATSPSHPDHWIDIAGYAACGGQCATSVSTTNSASPRIPNHTFEPSIKDSPNCKFCQQPYNNECHIK
jgi:hypothetical protein